MYFLLLTFTRRFLVHVYIYTYMYMYNNRFYNQNTDIKLTFCAMAV